MSTDDVPAPSSPPGTDPIAEQIKSQFEAGEQPKPPPKPDPAIQRYVDTKWLQNLSPMRTACFRCGVDSPVIFVPERASLWWGKPPRGRPDDTETVVRAFAKEGWQFEPRRAYCPTCKGLGLPA
jgi:hypothetical protein